MKDSILNPIPKTIRDFKYRWLKDEFKSYSDEEIRELLEKILKDDENNITINIL